MIVAGDSRWHHEWALRSRRVIHPSGFHRPAAILVRGEQIAAVVGIDEIPAGMFTVDAGDKMVLPGLVDSHVHINEPGRTDWEGFASATRAAAAGGVTTLIDMPLNSSPVTTTVAALNAKREAAAGKLWVDVGFHGGIVPGNADDVQPLIDAGVCAFKAFLCHSGIDEFPNATEADLRAVMPILAKAGLPLFVHAELIAPLPPGVEEAFAANPKSYAAYLATRPPEWERDAIRLLVRLCREYRCHVHIVHLAVTVEALPLIGMAKSEGLPFTFETCPHYLTFAAGDVPDGDTRFKCAPPIRGRTNRDRLRTTIIEGLLETIGSDHSPSPPELKHLDEGDFRIAWGGIASLQLLLSASWTAVPDLGLFPAITSRPAKLVGLGARKGSIASGFDADLVVFDPDATFIVDANALQHRHKITPYDGRTLRGVVETTYLRGKPIYDRGEFLGDASGKTLERTR